MSKLRYFKRKGVENSVDAQWLINAYGLTDALPAPSPITRWIQRTNAALETIPDLKGE